MEDESGSSELQKTLWQLNALGRDAEQETAQIDALQAEVEQTLKRLTLRYFPVFSQWDGDSIRKANEITWRVADRFVSGLAELSYQHGQRG